MTLFERITSGLSGAPEGGQSELLTSVMSMINNQGGLSGVVQSFKEKGLGDAVSSWVGTGQNQTISGDQIQSVFGSEQVRQIAAKLGMSTESASTGLASLLPQVIDKLTPNGSVPEGDLLEQGLSLFGDRGASSESQSVEDSLREDDLR